MIKLLVPALRLPICSYQPRLCLGLLAALVALNSSVIAATLTWTNGGDGLWSNTANWGGSTLNDADSVTFGSATATTTLNNDLTSVITGLYLGVVTFNADAPAYTIGGNAIIGNSTGATGGATSTSFVVNSATGVTQTMNNNLTLHQNAVNVSGTGNLTLTGTITKGGTWNPFIQMNGTGVLTLSGSNATNAGGSTNALTVNSGTVVLAKATAGAFNPNGVVLNGGTVQLAAAEQFKSAGSLTLNSGTLDLNGYDSNVNGGGTGVAVGVSGTTGGISVLNGVGGRITNNAAGSGTNWLVINQGGGQQGSYGGTISDGATAKVGVSVMANYNQSSFQALSGNNTYSGGTFIQHLYTGSGGRPAILSIGNVASIGSAGYRNLTFKGGASSADVILQLTGTAVTNSNQFDGLIFTSGLGAGIDIADPNNIFTLGKNAGGTDIAFAGAGVFEKLGAGTLVVTSSAITNTGGTYLGGGTLKIDAQSGGALAATSAPVFGGGNLYLLGKTSGTTTQTMGNVSLGQLNNYASSGGASMITVDANSGSGTTLTLGTLPNSTAAGYTLNIKTLTGGTVTTTTTTTTNGLVGNGRILFTDASSNVDFAGISASGTNRTVQAATYTTGLPATASSATVNYSQTGSAAVTASETVNALKLTTSGSGESLAISIGQTLSLKTGGLLFTGANDYSVTGGTLVSTNSATSPDLIIHQHGAGNLTIGSVITNGGSAASTLTKAGNGTLTLSGANTYTGQTFVTGGILSISSDSNIGGANGTFSGITSATNSVSVSSNAASLPAGFGVGSTMLGRTVNAITGTSGAYTITLSGNANTAFTANSGTASWATAGTLGLYSGGVLRADGTFSLQEVGTGGSGGAATTTANRNVTIGNSGGGFDVTTGNTLTIPGNITAAGMMTKSGAGTLVLGPTNTISGGLTIQDGTVRQTGNNSLSNNSTGGATSNLIFGNGAAPKFQLNNFSANVTSLVSSNTNAIVENGSATAGTKTLTVVNGADNTYAGKLQNGSAGVLALAKTGGGTLTLTNINAYTGTTTVTGGTLQVGSSGAGTTGTGAVTVQTGASILGTGTVKGSTFTAQSGSMVYAGDGTAQTNYGTLSFTPVSGSGSFIFESGSSTTLGINPGGAGDLLSFNGLSAGTLNFNGNLAVTASGYIPTSVDIFNLVDWVNLSTTTFDSRYSSGSYGGYLLGNGDDNLGFDLPDISGSGYGWDISQFTTDGTIRTVIVPEPSRMIFTLTGLLALSMRRRRRAVSLRTQQH